MTTYQQQIRITQTKPRLHIKKKRRGLYFCLPELNMHTKQSINENKKNKINSTCQQYTWEIKEEMRFIIPTSMNSWQPNALYSRFIDISLFSVYGASFSCRTEAKNSKSSISALQNLKRVTWKIVTKAHGQNRPGMQCSERLGNLSKKIVTVLPREITQETTG